MNVLAGWLVLWLGAPGRLWLGAAIIIGAITLLTHLEQRAHNPFPEVRHACLFLPPR
jgi:hypothetical protein